MLNEKKKVKPATGIITVSVPVGNITAEQVPEYIKTIAKQFETDSIKATGYEWIFLPIRPDGSGPKLEVIKF